MNPSQTLSPDLLKAQDGLVETIKEHFAANGDGVRRYFVDTYGCQQNEADSEILRGLAERMGYLPAAEENEADLILINTCAVREHAEQRVLSNVGALSHIKRRNPGLIIGVCGCMVTQSHMAEKIRKSYPYVDLVFNTHSVHRFPEILAERLLSGRRVFGMDESEGIIVEDLPRVRREGVKAWLSVMYGCNNFCSYCVVPYVRGRERSRDHVEIIREAKDLVAAGYREITLLGQNVNSYSGGTDFPGLLRELNEIEGEFFVRFMTSHPKDASNELFLAMAECDKVAASLHLPFQSGSDGILKAMNRGYTSAQYLEKIAFARSLMPHIVLTSDVIVGFPGETEADFEQTFQLIKTVGFDSLFTFIYSKREGTSAASLKDDTPREVKGERLRRLIDAQNEISSNLHAGCIGKTFRVLVDGSEEDGALSARTEGGRLVHFDGDAGLIGSFADVEIYKSSIKTLFGRQIRP